MPGYLTHVMVLIETEKWLSELERKLSDRKIGGSLSDLEAKALDLATKAREYLRFVPSTTRAVLPPASPAKIYNKIGDEISQYAYSGSIGPDFPGAAYIFALYQRWVHETMHKGSPRRAWLKAGSTEFVVNFIDSLNEIAAQEQRRPMMSYIIGHLSSIAAHVILRPFVNLVVWEREKIGRREFEVAIDASIVQWYFGKDDLNSPQNLLHESWTDYFLGDGDAIDRLMERYFKAFEKTYKSAEPLETLCALPSVKKLKSDFPELESSHFKTYPGLEEALARYPGYDNLLKRFDGLEKKLDESPFNKKFKDFLDDYEGRFAKLDRDMLVDGYKNTVNWAIDQGYDQGKPWFFRILWILLALGGGALVIFKVWDNTQNFSTISNNNPADVEEIKKLNRDAWQMGGFFANGRMWMDAIETSGMWSGLFFTFFAFLITGPPVIPWKGIFGQGIPDRHLFPKIYSFLKFIIFTVTGAILTDVFPGVFQKTEARVVKLLLSLGADGGSLAITLTEGNEEKGIQGDKLGAELWKAQYTLHLIYLVSCMFAFGVKSTRTATTGSGLETDPNWQDYMLGVLFFPAVGAILVGEGVLDKFLLEKTASVTWPDSNTGRVKAFLPTKNNDAGKVVLDTAKAVKFPVSLFKGDQLPADGDRKFYPEADADATPWAERPAKDEEERKKASSSSNSPEKTYTLKQLLDRTTILSGLLAMAAVNYDTVSATEKADAKAIFKDWNLDYRTVEEWNYLMFPKDAPQPPADGGAKPAPGLLTATEQWLSHLGGAQEAPTDEMMKLIREALATQSPSHFGRIEDRSVAPHNDAADTGHSFLTKGVEFKIIDRDGNVVHTGKTEADGRFGVTLPPGDDFELKIEHYEGLKT